MNQRPLVSIIVTTYCQEQTIRRTIDSILNQKTEYPFEIIIGEDNSPKDNTRAICEYYAKQYPEVIRLMPKAPNKGVLKNYHDCLNESRGKYIAGCAGDDWWHNPSKLQMQVDFLENNIDYGLVHTNYRVWNVDKHKMYSPTYKNYPQGYVYDRLFISNIVAAPTVMYRKSMLTYIDYESFRKNGIQIEDYPSWLEIAKHAKFYYIDIDTVTYSIAGGSLSNPKGVEQCVAFLEQVRLIKKYFITKYPQLNLDSCRIDIYYNRLIHRRLLAGFKYKKSFSVVDKLKFNKITSLVLKTYIGAFIFQFMALIGIYGRMKLLNNK